MRHYFYAVDNEVKVDNTLATNRVCTYVQIRSIGWLTGWWVVYDRILSVKNFCALPTTASLCKKVNPTRTKNTLTYKASYYTVRQMVCDWPAFFFRKVD